MRKNIARLRLLLFAFVLAAAALLASAPGARACSGDWCGCYIEEQACISGNCSGPTDTRCILQCRAVGRACEKGCCGGGYDGPIDY